MDENHLEIDDDPGMPDETINISDVIEVIETDPDFQESTMYNGGGEISHPIPQQHSRKPALKRKPYVEIIEQPAPKALRFRYECEGRSAGSIPGATSSSEHKTYPTIEVIGYKGRAVVVVSCVTKDEPYRAHPHNLVGRDGCKKGVCTMEISPENMRLSFSNLGIQCVKKKDIESALRVREEIKVDPFIKGFDHRAQPTSIDLNAVRLCFQVFLEGERPGKFTQPLTPVVSEPIYDKKAMSDLVIVKLSDCSSYVDGGRKDIILLCEKVAKEDIQVRFFEEKDDRVVWEGYGDFQPSQVHKQTAIWFRPPRYRYLDITEPVRVSIQLKRPSDDNCSEPLPFEFLPLDSEPGIKRKKQKFDEHFVRRLEETDRLRLAPQQQQQQPPQTQFLNIPMDGIKIEPRDKSPSPYGAQVYGLQSPNYTQNPSTSPRYMGPTPPPPVIDQMFGQDVPVSLGLPSFNSMMPNTMNWNLPSVSSAHNNNTPMDTWTSTLPTPIVQHDLLTSDQIPEFENVSGLSSLLNLDSQQLAYNPDLNLVESFSNNLSLTDLNGSINRLDDHNMTDSLTRLANNTYEAVMSNNNDNNNNNNRRQ